MYCTHYGFSEKPFDVTPDPRFLYMAPDHRETLASLMYGIRERRGFITIVGEVGTGKTTLLNAVLDRLDNNTKAAFIFNTRVTFEQMLNMVLYELGLVKASERLSKIDAIQRLNKFAVRQLAMDGRVVLIIDEAHNLSSRTMENLRMLSNLETRKHKLIQIVLSGQPELDTKLAKHELRQFTQRISLRRYVSPLNEKHTYAYLQHRLKVSKYQGSSLFDKKAQQLIWEHSGGIPRKINVLCDNALLIGYGLKQKKIHVAIIQEAAEDITWGKYAEANMPANSMKPAAATPRQRIKTKRRPFAFATALLLVGGLLFAAGYSLGRPGILIPEVVSFFEDTKAYIVQKIDEYKGLEQTQAIDVNAPVQTIVVQKIDTDNMPAKEAETTPPVKTINAKIVLHTKVENRESEPHVKEKGVSGLGALPDLLAVKDSIASEIPENHGPVLGPGESIEKKASPQETVALPIEKKTVSIEAVQTAPAKEEITKRLMDLQSVTVQKGQTLSKIISEAYGGYDEVILTQVLKENPALTDPDHIQVGQVIRLPTNN